jgi:FAD/FMN-containing dehydrogenase
VGAVWHNWAGNQQAQPQSVEHPRDVEEVVLAVKRAGAERSRVKVVGAGHSFTGAAATDGTLLHLDRMGLSPCRPASRSTGSTSRSPTSASR